MRALQVRYSSPNGKPYSNSRRRSSQGARANLACDIGHAVVSPRRAPSYTPTVQESCAARIGVLGGTFDPVHYGHLAVALEVRHQLGLEKVLMVVANDPWQKSAAGPVTPPDLRLEMVRAAVRGLEGIEASALEIDRGGESYTADTLAELRDARPDADLMLVVGSDAAQDLDTWQRPEELRRLATTVVVSRPGRSRGRPPDGWPAVVVEVPALDISSCDVRARFADGRPVAALVPEPVVELVRTRGLYGCSR